MKIIAVEDHMPSRSTLQEILLKTAPGSDPVFFSKPGEALDYLKNTSCDVVFTGIRLKDKMDGMAMAKEILLRKPGTNIIFCTDSVDYALDAFSISASGYLLKPLTEEAVKRQLENLRYPVNSEKKRIRFQCFGNFEVFLDGVPVHFQYDRTRELLAYLVDRCGAECTIPEIMAVLWEDDSHLSYLKMLRKDLVDHFEAAGVGDVLVRQRGRIGIDVSKAECDYYDWKKKHPSGSGNFGGEYMEQYSWAEFSKGGI